MDDYLGMLEEIEARYPGGTTRTITHSGRVHVIAYELPAQQ
jgi:hypothetical protein